MSAATADCPIQLRDATGKTGITFQHTDGTSGKHYIVEYVSAGLALFDYDGELAGTLGYDDWAIFTSVCPIIQGLANYFIDLEEWKHVAQLLLSVREVFNNGVEDTDDFYFKLALEWIPTKRVIPEHAVIAHELFSKLIEAHLPLVILTNQYDETLLHYAARNTGVQFMQQLLEKSADVNVIDKHCCTPLLRACRLCEYEAVTQLCRHGADPKLASGCGQSPVSIAKGSMPLREAIEKGTGKKFNSNENIFFPRPNIKAHSCPDGFMRQQSLPEFLLSSRENRSLSDSGVVTKRKSLQRQRSFSGSTMESIAE